MRIKKKADLVSAGDLKERIYLYTRDIQPPATGVKFTEKLGMAIAKWARVDTRVGVPMFDGSNMLTGNATHFFTIRSDDSINSEMWLECNGNYYDILSVEHLNENKRFQRLYCSIKGDTNLGINLL